MHDNANIKTNPSKVLEEKWVRRQKSVQIEVLLSKRSQKAKVLGNSQAKTI